MTIQKTQTAAPASETNTDVLAGNAEAGKAALKARAALENILLPAARMSLRAIPTTKLRLLAVAEAIEREELVKQNIGFNMKVWHEQRKGYQDQTGHTCGTVACIAGWTALLDDVLVRGNGNIARRAEEILGISHNEANLLFSGHGRTEVYLEHISAKYAVAVLRDFAETGSVHWERFNNEGKRV